MDVGFLVAGQYGDPARGRGEKNEAKEKIVTAST
jgi:hypothetical protein